MMTPLDSNPFAPRPAATREWMLLIAAGVFSAALTAGACGQTPAASQTSPQDTPASPADNSTTSAQQPQELDKVIAIINGDVLLQSDVQEELQFAVLQPPGRPGIPPSPARDQAEAGRRVINRTLILQQMKSQQVEKTITDDDVRKNLADLRKQLPACAPYHCETDEGWAKFLKAHNLTEEQVMERWHQRLEIVNFIDIRFRNGIRISKPEIQAYYDKDLVPAFQNQKAKAPPLTAVSSRIEEVLLQQRVTTMLSDWLTSLRKQGSVQILDPAYGTSSDNSEEGGGA